MGQIREKILGCVEKNVTWLESSRAHESSRTHGTGVGGVGGGVGGEGKSGSGKPMPQSLAV